MTLSRRNNGQWKTFNRQNFRNRNNNRYQRYRPNLIPHEIDPEEAEIIIVKIIVILTTIIIIDGVISAVE